MTLDTFRSFGRSLVSPPEQAAPIAPCDSEVTLAEIADGSLVPIRAVQVFATGTTATALAGLW